MSSTTWLGHVMPLDTEEGTLATALCSHILATKVKEDILALMTLYQLTQCIFTLDDPLPAPPSHHVYRILVLQFQLDLTVCQEREGVRAQLGPLVLRVELANVT